MDRAAADGFLETERKFEVDADFAIPDLTGTPAVAAVGAPQTYHLRATYYDTADFRLAAARITLRERSGGADDGWHLKLPAGADSRREIHEPPAPGSGRTVPARLAALVREQTGGQPLRPIATLATTRTVRHLTGADGRALAEIADDSVTGALPGTGRPPSPDHQPAAADNSPERAGAAPVGGDGTPLAWREAARWREVEVELLAGTGDLLDAVGARLRAAGARPAALGSKLARLLAAR